MRNVRHLLLLLLAGPLAAHATSITWTGDDIVAGTQTIAVEPFLSSAFTGVNGVGTYGQEPGYPQYGTLEAYIGGTWQNVASTAFGAAGPLSALLQPSAFPVGIVSALRLTDQNNYGPDTSSCTFFGGCFQGLNKTHFNFNDNYDANFVSYSGQNIVAGTDTITFSPFYSNEFYGVAGPATFGQEPGYPQTGTVEARVDGVWETIGSTGFGGSGVLGGLFSPVAFSGGEVDALRLTDQNNYIQDIDSCTYFGGCFQNLNLSSFAFNVATPPPPAPPIAATPEPSTLILLGTGLFGAAGAMRKRFHF